MTSYTIEYTDGRVTDIAASNDRDAVKAAMARFDGGVHGDWEPCGADRERMLIWASEADADGPNGNGDDGAKAVAQLAKCGPNAVGE